jgi:hypothetical protein
VRARDVPRPLPHRGSRAAGVSLSTDADRRERVSSPRDPWIQSYSELSPEISMFDRCRNCSTGSIFVELALGSGKLPAGTVLPGREAARRGPQSGSPAPRELRRSLGPCPPLPNSTLSQFKQLRRRSGAVDVPAAPSRRDSRGQLDLIPGPAKNGISQRWLQRQAPAHTPKLSPLNRPAT